MIQLRSARRPRWFFNAFGIRTSDLRVSRIHVVLPIQFYTQHWRGRRKKVEELGREKKKTRKFLGTQWKWLYFAFFFFFYHELFDRPAHSISNLDSSRWLSCCQWTRFLWKYLFPYRFTYIPSISWFFSVHYYHVFLLFFYFCVTRIVALYHAYLAVVQKLSFLSEWHLSTRAVIYQSRRRNRKIQKPRTFDFYPKTKYLLYKNTSKKSLKTH